MTTSHEPGAQDKRELVLATAAAAPLRYVDPPLSLEARALNVTAQDRGLAGTAVALVGLVAERDQRRLGLWIGGGLSMLSLAGTVALALVNGPVVIAVGLVGMSFACAGAAMVLAGGGSVTAADMARMSSALRLPPPSSKGAEEATRKGSGGA